jgi:hypothetical protein
MTVTYCYLLPYESDIPMQVSSYQAAQTLHFANGDVEAIKRSLLKSLDTIRQQIETGRYESVPVSLGIAANIAQRLLRASRA